MKNKLLYLALIAPCAIVGCKSNDSSKESNSTTTTTSSTSFKTGVVDYITAAEFVKENYDGNVLDYSTGTLNVGILNMDVNGTTKTNNSSLGTIEDGSYNQNFGNFKLTLHDIPSVVLSSSFINDIQGMYARFSLLTLQFLTKVGIDVIYNINEDKSMDITIKTNSDTALFDLVSVFFPIIHSVGVFGSAWSIYLDNTAEKQAEKAKADQGGTVQASYADGGNVISKKESKTSSWISKVLNPYIEPLVSYILGNNVADLIKYATNKDNTAMLSYLQIFALMGFGVAPNSTMKGEFGLVISTDSNGYLKSASYNLWADYNLNLVSNIYRGFPQNPVNGITQEMIDIYKAFVVPDLTINNVGKANYKFGFTWGTK